MTPQQIEALKLALEALEAMAEDLGYFTEEVPAITALEEVLAEHAMRETQRLGQEIEQEQNFCPRCGKRTKDIHTCTPPKETT